MIAFLGTGLMGSAFVRALLARGEAVTVWNRTRSRAEPLAKEGAVVADDPAQAVRDARRVHLALLDDAVVDDVLAQLLPALEAGAVIVDHSTTATQPTAARARRMQQMGVKFLHAPVFMGPSNALDATGSMFVAGPQAVFDEVRPDLQRMTDKLRYVGERPDLAAAYKLFGNMLLMFVASGIADVLSLARAVDVDPIDAVSVFADFNAAAQVSVRGQRMASGSFLPAAFELSAARKDVRLMLDSAAAAGGSLHVLPAIAARFDQIIAAGYGDADLAAAAAEVP
jgi:3-hydroxyisobutyrate dehydrogenase-like beta-hydroxyacid dehydrogenase